MWAQCIKARLKPGKEDEARAVAQEFEAHVKATGVGPIRVVQFQNQNDPLEHLTIAYFESEEKARESERHPEQGKLIQRFWEVYEGQPEYADLNPYLEWSR